MYVWLVCFVVLFGLVELYPWVQGFALPFPVMLLAGVGLAIASNLDTRNKLPDRPTSPSPQVSLATAPPPSVAAAVPDSAVVAPPPQQTPLTASPPSDSISFTIHKR